ncbi:TPA: DUF3577 domain-containing protein [Burkholderia vietnamiensis]|nr:DUF3577 domain-containing protein [Burkholderia vietnamiensis]
MNQSVEPRKYFDLHLRGLGYLSRVRDVASRGNGRSKAKPFLACSISAFHGDPNVDNGIVYLPLDLIVSGEKAKEAVRSVMDDANDRDVKVLVAFRSGDHYIRTFERTGNRAGETGSVLKGRLLKLFWIKVDGQEVWRDEGDDTEAGADSSREIVEARESSTGHLDDRSTPEVGEPVDGGTDEDSGEGAPAVDATSGPAAPRTNRYPPLRRQGGGNIRQPAAGNR